jgi:hypothetical protein
LRHTAREVGLAGAVGVLGLGLVAEHFSAKRRAKKQQRQIDKHHKEAVRTNQALQREQTAHLQTRQELHRLADTQVIATSASEQVRYERPQEVQLPSTSSEAVTSAGLAATEFAPKLPQTPRTVEAAQQSISVAPEGIAEQIARQSLEQAPANINTEHFKAQELVESAAALTAANRLTHETRHERLQDKLNDKGGRTGGGTSNGLMASLPQPQSFSHAPILQSGVPSQSTKNADHKAAASKLTNPWTWLIVGLVLLAVVAAAVSK